MQAASIFPLVAAVVVIFSGTIAGPAKAADSVEVGLNVPVLAVSSFVARPTKGYVDMACQDLFGDPLIAARKSCMMRF